MIRQTDLAQTVLVGVSTFSNSYNVIRCYATAVVDGASSNAAFVGRADLSITIQITSQAGKFFDTNARVGRDEGSQVERKVL